MQRKVNGLPRQTIARAGCRPFGHVKRFRITPMYECGNSVCYGVFKAKDPHVACGRLNLSKFKYRVLLNIRPIRNDVQLILCVGMRKDAPTLLEAKFV